LSNVQLSIGGRSYTVACADGEEEHIVALGGMIDSKLATGGAVPVQSESRSLLFAALLLADELHECRAASLRQDSLEDVEARLAGHAAALAERLENLADRLESGEDAH
jgi:cell division protein ZapA